VSRWANGNGFPISTEKTKAMLIYRRKPKVSRNPKMKIWIGTEKIAMVKHHCILGLVKLNLTKCLSHTNWGADQMTLLKIHQMIILSTLRYGETAYPRRC
jgi:hypothetical protein